MKLLQVRSGALALSVAVAGAGCVTSRGDDRAQRDAVGATRGQLTLESEPATGTVHGSAHVLTLDGLAYDFQQAGEYVLITDGDALTIHARFAPVRGLPAAAAVMAVAADVAGDRVAYTVDSNEPLRVNGAPAAIPSGGLTLPNGGMIARTATSYAVTWPNGEELTFSPSRWLDLKVTVPDRETAYEGLLGTWNGDPYDDLVARSGVVMAPPLANEELHDVFGDSWRVLQSESLLHYAEGQDTSTFSDHAFPSHQLTARSLRTERFNAAYAACTGAGVTDRIGLESCIMDVASSDDAAAAQTAAAAGPTRSDATPFATQFYAQDFEGWDDNLWWPSPHFVAPETPSFGSTQVLGPVTSDQVLRFQQEGMRPHSNATLAFDLHVLGGWNGHRFDVAADGNLIASTTFSNQVEPQAFPGRFGVDEYPAQAAALAVDTLDFGTGEAPRAVYHVSYTFAHAANMIELTLSAQDLPLDAAWAIDNVEIVVGTVGQPWDPRCSDGQSLDDGNPCTVDSCDPEAGALHAPRAAGTSCSDGDPCSGEESCNGTGECGRVSPTLDDSNSCTEDLCDPRLGAVRTPYAAGTACSNGDHCDGLELCNAFGTCLSGTPPEPGELQADVTCDGIDDDCDGALDEASCDDQNPCTEDSCDPSQGCRAEPLEGQACDDADVCTVGETCDASGDCVAAAALDCSDGLFCNGLEGCISTEGCIAGIPPNPDDGIPCTEDTCDEVADLIVHTPVDLVCDDHDLCNGAELCGVDSGCVAGPPPVVDDLNGCTVDACDPELGVSHVFAPAGASCGGGRYCGDAGECLPLGHCATHLVLPAGQVTVLDGPCEIDSIAFEGGTLIINGDLQTPSVTLTGGGRLQLDDGALATQTIVLASGTIDVDGDVTGALTQTGGELRLGGSFTAGSGPSFSLSGGILINEGIVTLPVLDSSTFSGGTLVNLGRLDVLSGAITIVEGATLSEGGWLGTRDSIASVLVQGALTHPIRRALSFTVTGDLTIANGGVIDVSGRGLRGGARDGNASILGEVYSADLSGVVSAAEHGGSHGGLGGQGLPTYGSPSAPVLLGSGGGGALGGNGGGSVDLVVRGTLTVDGALRADGQASDDAAGGAGGSLRLRVGHLTGTGPATANGGEGVVDGGGGGRIAIEYVSSDYSGTLEALGAASAVPGLDGTITSRPQSAGVATPDLASTRFATCTLDHLGAIACVGDDVDGLVSEAPTGIYATLSLGSYSACALHDSGLPHCWGAPGFDGSLRRVPPLELSAIGVARDSACGLRSADSSVVCWGVDAQGLISGVPSGPFVDVAVSDSTACATDAAGLLTCWGDDSHGQVTDRPTVPVVQVDAGADHFCAVLADATLSCWGNNTSGQAAAPAGAFSRVTAGTNHSCAIDGEARVSCWGDNSMGQASPPDFEFDRIAAGEAHTCAMTPAGALVCWGGIDGCPGDLDCDGAGDEVDNCSSINNPSQIDSDEPLDPSLDGLHVWRFEEPSGSTAIDLTGRSPGTLVGGVTRAGGRFGAGLQFAGTDGYVSVDSTAPGVTQTFTMEFWALPEATHRITPQTTFGVHGISDMRYALYPTWGEQMGPGHTGAGVSVGTNGITVFEHGANYMPSVLVFQQTLSGWLHIAVVYSDGVPQLYLDGGLVATGLQTGRTVHPGGVPGGTDAPYGYFKGLLDEVAIYPRALSPDEIGRHAAQGLYGDGYGDACDPCPLDPLASCSPE